MRSQGEVSRDELALYDLIWRARSRRRWRMPSGGRSRSGSARRPANEDVEFGASGTVITFRGFLAAYEEGRDEPSDDAEERASRTSRRETRSRRERSRPRATRRRRRRDYTEATLVRALEERGIGRPSTYAAILSTIVDRGYVFKKGSALVPTFVAFAVVNLLEQHFRQLVDFDFTARMEDDLDRDRRGPRGASRLARSASTSDGRTIPASTTS